jgi:hypothetical protein
MSTEMMRRAFLQTGVPTVSRRNSRFLTVALMLWIGSGALGQAEAGSVLATPAGLKPGDQFRIVFATDGTTMATSTTITDYDNFVTNQAQGATYNGQTVQWLAIVSVEFTNAIDHIGQSTSPIYLANGTQVTTSTTASGLWSGALESPIFTDLNGQLVHGQIWTGTNADGVTVPGQALGDASAVVGSNRQISAGWIETGVDSFISSHSLYGISQVLTVALTQQPVPEPSSIVMLGMALLVAAYIRRFRNAKLCVRVIHIDAAYESSCVPNGYA